MNHEIVESLLPQYIEGSLSGWQNLRMMRLIATSKRTSMAMTEYSAIHDAAREHAAALTASPGPGADLITAIESSVASSSLRPS